MRASAVLALIVTLGLGPQTVSAQTDPLAALRAAAEAGDVPAQLALAERLETGDGVLQNYARAAQWYARAAEAGDLTATNKLGRLYHAGLGVPRDPERALALLERAADSGAAEDLYDLALVLETARSDDASLARAAELYRRAAEAGHLDAAVSLGVLLQDGKGVPQDFAAAAELYRSAADKGHPKALNNLGLLYVRGDGVAQDYERAAQLFKAAAEQGLPQAMTNLGVLYDNGFGVPQSDELAALYYRQGGQAGASDGKAPQIVYDPRLAPPAADTESLRALERAARAGDPVAEFQVAYLMLNAHPLDPRRAVQAAQLMRRAAEAGHAPAMANTGLLYFGGTGVPQDYVMGQMWLLLASSSGFDRASGFAVFWNSRMTPEQINEAQTRAEAKWAEWRNRP
ncbi:SEL1-like repeat protein [Mameliella alba]|nr:SEL1-like repeat protein [Antarctobacter heliothermus]MBY6143457.1 SEL1-like repeat protein [Mameliella alba]MCA0952819.1 hypothetical protein [Mameliella alba]